MRKFNLAFVWVFLASCGGGSSGGGNSPPPTAASPQQLSPTWSLQRAMPSQLNATQAEVDTILNHIFGDQAVQSATLVKAGYIIGERFTSGITADDRGTSWSVAKSFYSAAIGVAIDEGWITSMDQPASDFLTEWVGTNKEDITVRHLLEMRGGFQADRGIYAADDQTQFALNFMKTAPENTDFVYSNTTSQLFEPLLERATGLDAHTYLRQKILTPIGIDSNGVGMWFDRTGQNPITYFGLDMRPIELARFGLLYARGGTWDGQQIISPSYVQDSLRAQSPFYGFQWWVLNNAFFGQSVPISVVAALGLDGQKIYVWPDQDIVLVVQTTYVHSQNQGYTLSDSNFPDTCSARSSCPGRTGTEVPSYDEHALMLLLEPLGD